jgi:4-hydroxyphenylpyruvate dioxygenase
MVHSPHEASKSVLVIENPAGMDGFEFVELASSDPQELRDVYAHGRCLRS